MFKKYMAISTEMFKKKLSKLHHRPFKDA